MLDEMYRQALDGLRNAAPLRVLGTGAQRGYGGFDARLKFRTDAGDRELLVQQYRSHLSHKNVDHIVAAARQKRAAILILAPHIGAGLADKLVAAGLNYLDAHGNCHIVAPPLFIHIEGRKAAPVRAADKGIRSAGYQVLFCFLAEPALLDQRLREVAEQAGTSRQPVSDIKRRLVDEAYVFATSSRTRWHPRRRQDALNLWLHGYETTVRPSLLRGNYRTQDASPEDLEPRLAETFEHDRVPFRWGGCAAGARLSGHYRGERTVVHVRTAPGDLSKRLRALPDPPGNLVVMDAFGHINWQRAGDTVHPLLVYSEMLFEGSERAREAAQIVLEKHLLPIWERES